MADAGNMGTADGKDSKGNITINNFFPDATISNFANQTQDGSSQNSNIEKPCSPASAPQPVELPPPTVATPPPPSRKSATFVIEGSIQDLTPTDLARLQAFVESLRKRTGDASLTVIEFSEGSIRIILEGSEDGIAKLQELVEAGELSEVLDRPLQQSDFADSETYQSEGMAADPIKAMLIEKIRSGETNLNKAFLWKANLSGAELGEVNFSGAQLRKANLSGANLRKANFRTADLRDANLRDADLKRADLWKAYLLGAELSKADLSGANLSEAYLIRANLDRTDLRDANVRDAVFSGTRGLTELVKADLKFRGAIFDDAPGDRSKTLTPVTPRR